MECKLYLSKAAKIVLKIFFKKREYCVLTAAERCDEETEKRTSRALVP